MEKQGSGHSESTCRRKSEKMRACSSRTAGCLTKSSTDTKKSPSTLNWAGRANEGDWDFFFDE